MGYFVFSMILFAIAGGLFAAGRIMRTRYESDIRMHRYISPVIALLAILFLMLSMIFSVPNNHIGIENQWGKVIATHSEGLRLKSPFSNIINLPGTQQESTYSKVPQEGEKNRQDAIEAVTRDNAIVDIDMSVLWSLDLNLGGSIYREYRSIDNIRTRLLRPTSRKVVRDCVAQHAFEEARTSERAAIAECAESGLRDETAKKGIIIRAVQVRNMSARSAELQASIDRKLASEQAARQAEFEKDKATVEAETAKVKATGEAEAQIERARGEAESNKLIDESLTPSILSNRYIEAMKEANQLNIFSGDSQGNVQPVLPITPDG